MTAPELLALDWFLRLAASICQTHGRGHIGGGGKHGDASILIEGVRPFRRGRVGKLYRAQTRGRGFVDVENEELVVLRVPRLGGLGR